MSSPSTGSAGSSSWSTGALLQLLLAVLLFAAVLLVWQATAAHACITIVVGDKATNGEWTHTAAGWLASQAGGQH